MRSLSSVSLDRYRTMISPSIPSTPLRRVYGLGKTIHKNGLEKKQHDCLVLLGKYITLKYFLFYLSGTHIHKPTISESLFIL